MIVYGSSLSPFVRKVLVFAAEKAIEIDYKPLPRASPDPEFRSASPFGKVPALRDGDFTLSDSSAIIAYLDALQPQPVLVPADPQARARVIWFEEFADGIFCGALIKIFFNRLVGPRFEGIEGDQAMADKAEAQELPPALDYLERSLEGRTWLVGDRMTLADIAAASPLVNLAHLGIAPKADRYPNITAFGERMLARLSFKYWVDKENAFLARAG